MKRFSILLLAATMCAGMFATIGAQAACPKDKFGSCEEGGDLKCASDATSVGGLFWVDSSASSGNGVQACNDGRAGALPAPLGRAGVWTDGSSVQAHVDGDRDQAPTAGAWTSVSASAGGVCVKRGSGGSYTADLPDALNECAP